MPDWEELVRRKLSAPGSEPPVGDEVILELAAHLEENWEALRGQGVADREALGETLLLAEDWQELYRKIQVVRRVEETMNQRVRQFWFPGFLTLLLAMGWLALIQWIGPRPWVISRETNRWSMIAPTIVVYLPWLLILPVIGAVGAVLSTRAGASRLSVLSSIVFPVLPYLIFFLIGFPIALILEEHVAHNIMFGAFLFGFFAWVVAPGFALLAGGLLAQRLLSRSSGSRQIARG